VRELVRGEYRVSSLMKQNKKAKICLVIYIAGFFFKKKICYEVFAKPKKTKESNNYYCCCFQRSATEVVTHPDIHTGTHACMHQ
jgi:hypothetical protein